jgi:hypothetical protein
VEDGSPFSLTIRTKEERCSEDSLKGSDKSPVLRASCCIPNVSSMAAVLSKTIRGDFGRIA